jgi:hypothetical protein
VLLSWFFVRQRCHVGQFTCRGNLSTPEIKTIDVFPAKHFLYDHPIEVQHSRPLVCRHLEFFRPETRG